MIIYHKHGENTDLSKLLATE